MSIGTMPDRAFTVANLITALRLACAPVFVILLVAGRYEAALGVLIVAAVSDGADGFVARVFHQRSGLGVALDPIADKVLMITACAALSARGALPWWLTFLVICRDVAILAAAAFVTVFSGYRALPPTLVGKVSTASQLAAILSAVGYKAQVWLVSKPMLDFFIYLAGVLTVVSGIHYFIIGRQRLESRAQHPLV